MLSLKSDKKGFVCQNCSRLVPSRTDRCPYCGRFFKGVRCPECLYVGVADDFFKGCPSCGYLSDPNAAGKKGYEDKTAKKPGKDLPVWFYLISLGVLVISIIVLGVLMFNMS